MAIVTIDLPLDIIHSLYKLAIEENTVMDKVVENILYNYIRDKNDKEVIKEIADEWEEKYESFCEYYIRELGFPSTSKVVIKSCTPDEVYSVDYFKGKIECPNCGRPIHWIEEIYK